jgi:hypothetical protein
MLKESEAAEYSAKPDLTATEMRPPFARISAVGTHAAKALSSSLIIAEVGFQPAAPVSVRPLYISISGSRGLAELRAWWCGVKIRTP